MTPRRAAGIALVSFLLAAAFALGLFLTARSPGILPPTHRASGCPGVAAAGDRRGARGSRAASYYRPVERDVLEQPTITGLLRELGDPNTDFLTAVEYDSLKSRTARSYSGVGLTVEPSRAGLVVTSALNGPARQAGVRRGDIIVRIEGRPAGKLTFDQALNLIKGEKGTVVHLTLRRPEHGRLRVTVVRQEITLPSLRARLIRFHGAKLGYLRLLSFPDATAERLGAGDRLPRPPRGARESCSTCGTTRAGSSTRRCEPSRSSSKRVSSAPSPASIRTR